MRPDTDDLPTDWWFCSTAIPLLAATIGPLANVLSIAALVTSWRQNYNSQFPDVDDQAVGFPDPKWCLGLNGASLACGFVGNFFLLLNFTRRVRYIVALPVTIVLWYAATGIVSFCPFLFSCSALFSGCVIDVNLFLISCVKSWKAIRLATCLFYQSTWALLGSYVYPRV